MDEEIILKIKENRKLEILRIASIVFFIVLFCYAIISKLNETTIQSTFIIVFAFIIDFLNYGEVVINEKGIKTKTVDFIKYNEISKIKLKKRNLIVYKKESEKPLKLIVSQYEDYKTIQKAYLYIDAKLKVLEENEKEHKEYVEKYF